MHWNPFDQNTAADFFDPEWMFQLGNGFDVVIGNPPYVRQEEIKHLKDGLKAHYNCYTGTADLYVYFYERSIKLLKPHGVFAFISSNKWYRAKYGEKLRDWMNCNTKLRRIIDFGDEAVFTAIAYPTIVIATRRAQTVKAPGQDEDVLTLNWTQEDSVEQFPQVFAQTAFPVPQAELSKYGWQLEPPLKRHLLERVRAAGKPLGEYVNGRLYYGIKTGLNDAFVISRTKRAELIAEDPKSMEVIKPFLRGRDVKRWRVEPQDLWLLYIPWHFPLHLDPSINGASAKAEREFKRQFPAIFNHLLKYKDTLSARNQAETGVRYEWYALQRWGADYWQEFEQLKIVFPDIALSPQFAWEDSGRYVVNTAYIIPRVGRWLLAVLNSSVCAWFYSQISPQIQNGYYRFIAQYVEQIPIPSVAEQYQILLDALVSNVWTTRDSRFEQLINGLVYELFFPEDLHRANVWLFDACEKAGIAKLTALKGKAIADAANDLAIRIFATSHPIYGMLFDLQALDVVRIVEDRG